MLDAEETFREVMRRSSRIRRARRRQVSLALSGATGCLAAMLVATACLLFEGAPAIAGGSRLGSLLLGEEAGGYALVGVLAFLLGATVTLLCVKLSKKDPPNEKTQKNGKAEE